MIAQLLDTANAIAWPAVLSCLGTLIGCWLAEQINQIPWDKDGWPWAAVCLDQHRGKPSYTIWVITQDGCLSALGPAWKATYQEPDRAMHLNSPEQAARIAELVQATINAIL